MPKGIKGFQMGHLTSEETRKKIGLANRGKWVKFLCEFCNKHNEQPQYVYKKYSHHFCNLKCYKKWVKTRPFYEQHAYMGIRKKGQTKQVYHQNYCYKHPKRIAHLKSRRYAREQGAEGFHTFEDWNNLKIEFDNRCAFCRKKTKLTKDHIIPLSEGGTDWIENIQPLCKSCNSKKWKHIY